MTSDDERIALFLDYENLAIGARDALGGCASTSGPIADALAERGRVVVRRAYADWSYFEEDRRMLTRHQVELIEIPQRMGMVRKNAADIKMAVDAIELSLRTRLHHDVRARHRRQRLHPARPQAARAEPTRDRHRRRGVDLGAAARRRATSSSSTSGSRASSRGTGPLAAPRDGRPRARSRRRSPSPRPEPEPVVTADETDLDALVTRTLAGLERSSSGPVLASMLKRAILRKDPTFSEADYGFRTFGELLRNLADRRRRRGAARGARRAIPRSRSPTGRRRRGRRVRAAALDGRAARRRRARRTSPG